MATRKALIAPNATIRMSFRFLLQKLRRTSRYKLPLIHPTTTLVRIKAITADAASVTATAMRKLNNSTVMMFLCMPKVCAHYWMNNDREAETKAQKPKPMTIDKSQPFMSTISPPLGLASAAPLTGCQRKAGCRRAARARLIAQGIRVDQGRRDRHDKAAESIELSFISPHQLG